MITSNHVCNHLYHNESAYLFFLEEIQAQKTMVDITDNPEQRPKTKKFKLV